MHLGTHYLAEFFDCDRIRINDLALVESVMIEATEWSGARIIKSMFHQFSPHGISGVIVIEESHFAFHSWPEHGYAAVDLFSCADFDYRAALTHIRENIGAGSHSVTRVKRGVLNGDGRPRPCEWEEIDIDR